jgi:hypothetical protein
MITSHLISINKEIVREIQIVVSYERSSLKAHLVGSVTELHSRGVRAHKTATAFRHTKVLDNLCCRMHSAESRRGIISLSRFVLESLWPQLSN